ncbi:hypothetical protein [Romboutsia sp. 1001216sp1]|uniref:hypothetical protein n=1 Tax=Romboutsia sp. 1001216sp1 TaxID=2986997 RepID=UPI00232E727A|nr:hypothetical protein [Romboutsia sp. 1001216sp1]MDB8803610.1 hypothetical protein [Romboutsia sp. 1001216sp1]MDB8807888.1 hypothetical protein [Romboutsia sp. 1001216sp1]MDB8809258.1 hypothetical protein [Romboutsia sp. 1001216sp1]MDB8815006.1 hypothetical protein [Romboutsia sp. 1001216sp1]MDB8819739.1 hypothetical protein [Romboutsia sp. 1001216sp1]
MDKYNKLFKLTRALTYLFILSVLILIFTGFIIGEGEIVQYSVGFFVISFISCLVIGGISLIIKIIYLNSMDRKRRLINALKDFLCSFIVLFILEFILKSSSINLGSIFSISFGSAVGINFGDLIFFNHKI